MVDLKDFRSFVVADLPGLIEGAHKGNGLGDQFLKHIERNEILLHVVDISHPERDPVQDYKTIVRELMLYNKELSERQQVVVASKADALQDSKRLSRLKAMCSRRKIPFLRISSVTGEGIPELIHRLEKLLGV